MKKSNVPPKLDVAELALLIAAVLTALEVEAKSKLPNKRFQKQLWRLRKKLLSLMLYEGTH